MKKTSDPKAKKSVGRKPSAGFTAPVMKPSGYEEGYTKLSNELEELTKPQKISTLGSDAPDVKCNKSTQFPMKGK